MTKEVEHAQGPWDLAEGAAKKLDPKLFEPFIRKAADDIYGRLLDMVQDYLVDNAAFNLGSKLMSLTSENERQRAELYAVDKALHRQIWMAPREEIIARHLETERRYNELVYAVANAFEGEERYETALRYIRERETGETVAAAIARAGGR